MRHFRGSIPFGRRCAILFLDRTLFFSEREYLNFRILQYAQSESKMKKDVQIERRTDREGFSLTEEGCVEKIVHVLCFGLE